MRRFLAVVAIAFAIRGALVWIMSNNVMRAYQPDSIGYENLALHMSMRQEFSNYDGPEITRTPGYPLFLAMAGRTNYALWIQALLGALTCGFVYLIAVALWDNRKAAQAAGLWLAIDAVSILHGGVILSETLYTFLFIWAFGLLVIAIKKQSNKYAIPSGICFGLAALVRPIGLMYAPFAAVVLATLPGARHRGIRYLAPFVIASMLAPAAWTARNYVVSGYWAFSKQAKLETWAATAERNRPTLSKADNAVRMFAGHGADMAAWLVLEDPRYDPLVPPEQYIGQARGTVALGRRHPGLAATFAVYMLFLLWIYWRALTVTSWTAIYFATGNKATGIGNPFYGCVLAATPIIYHAVLNIALAHCYYRQRVPIMPFIFLLASRGLFHDRKTNRRSI
jgi:hypothetical protein